MSICRIEGLYKYYPVASGLSALFSSRNLFVRAVDGIDFEIGEGEILGIAGESGSGKTTTGEILVGLQNPTRGRIIFQGTDLSTIKGRALKNFRRKVQMIFQDPYATLNPRFTIGATVAEPLIIHRLVSPEMRREKVKEALEMAELRPASEFIDRFPHELSGGQRQRVAISRAIVLSPRLLVADEPVSMLDVSVRAGILNLLKRLRDQLGISILYISHDLSTIGYLCDRIAIMYLGKIIEIGPSREVVTRPRHPYTHALMRAVPVPDPFIRRERAEIKGELPDQIHLSAGCRFSPRCPKASDTCRQREPELVRVDGVHSVACHHRL